MWFHKGSLDVLHGWVLKKSRTFLVFVVPGGHHHTARLPRGSSSAVSFRTHLHVEMCYPGDQGVAFYWKDFISDFTRNQTDHTHLEISGRRRIRNGMNGIRQASLNSYFMTNIRRCVCLVLCCPEATKYYTTRYTLIFLMIFSDSHQIGFLAVLLGQEQRCAFCVSTQCLKSTTWLSQCLFSRLGSISNVGRRNRVCISMRGRPYLELGGFVLLVTARHSDDICGRSVILHRLRLLLFARSCFYSLSCHWY